jgi:hypothetical protein
MNDFFATFEPKDWVTSALALAAIVIAGGSLIQNHFFRPRPHFTIEWHDESLEVNGVLATFCRFWNDGDATARNVRVTVEGDGIVCNLPVWDRWDEFEPGKRHGFEVPLEPAVYGFVSLRDRAFYAPEGAPVAVPASASGWAPPRTRTEVLRPVVTIRYRGRWRPITSKAPALPGTPIMGGC